MFSLEIEMCRLVEACEEGVIECEKQIAEEKKTPEEKSKEAEAVIAKWRKFHEEKRKKSK